MNQKFLFLSAVFLLLLLFISCNEKEVTGQRTSRSGKLADTISTTHTANENSTNDSHSVSGGSRTYKLEGSGDDRSLYVLASILIVSLFFKTIKLNKVRGA